MDRKYVGSHSCLVSGHPTVKIKIDARVERDKYFLGVDVVG